MKGVDIISLESFLCTKSYKFLIIVSKINITDLGNGLADIP